MKRKTRTALIGTLFVLIGVTITGVVCWVLYIQTIGVLTGELRQRLIAIARTAAVEFDTNDLEQLQQENDYLKPQWAKVVNQLLKVRLNNDQVLFTYIVRKNKNDPTLIEFVSDSHSLNPFAKIDLNHDGEIDDADLLQWPGQPYTDPPEEIFDAYDHPTTSKELIYDQWGVEIVGYAPIRDVDQRTVAVMAVDMSAKDFVSITRQTLRPFVEFIIFLVLVIVSLVWTLVYLWNRQAESLEIIDRQKDELLSMVSHQLASPITSLKWYLEMLQAGDLGKLEKEQRETMDTMQKVAVTLSDLVSMILDVSRIQLGKIKTDPAPLDLNEFFKEIMSVIDPKATERKIRFEKKIPGALPTVLLDRRYTRMTVENLLTNAVKYTPEQGDVSFTVSLADSRMRITVKDTGCGIPKDEQSKIFGKMFRASNVRNAKDGNGFGLYVAKGAIEAQGGKIWFESEEGRGTTFYVELPVRVAGEEQVSALPRKGVSGY